MGVSKAFIDAVVYIAENTTLDYEWSENALKLLHASHERAQYSAHVYGEPDIPPKTFMQLAQDYIRRRREENEEERELKEYESAARRRLNNLKQIKEGSDYGG